MNKRTFELIKMRSISSAFSMLAIVIFKPFQIVAGLLSSFMHLIVLWVLGVVVCLVSDGILSLIFRKPMTYEHGVNYIIRRNLWFQFINTPLVSLMICTYRHFLLGGREMNNHLSWDNFIETLLVNAFCSFSIGLYWRFKFRNRFLAAELMETRILNAHLQSMQQEQEGAEEAVSSADATSDPVVAPVQPTASTITLTGSTNDSLTLQMSDLLYIEAMGNYVKIFHLRDGAVRSDMLRATSRQIEDELNSWPMVVRCHRAFLVNLGQVEQIESKAGTMQLLMKHSHESIPVSRSNMADVKRAVKCV